MQAPRAERNELHETLGDLIVDFDGSSEPKLSSPSGHAAGDGIENTVDEDPDRVRRQLVGQVLVPESVRPICL